MTGAAQTVERFLALLTRKEIDAAADLLATDVETATSCCRHVRDGSERQLMQIGAEASAVVGVFVPPLRAKPPRV